MGGDLRSPPGREKGGGGGSGKGRGGGGERDGSAGRSSKIDSIVAKGLAAFGGTACAGEKAVSHGKGGGRSSNGTVGAGGGLVTAGRRRGGMDFEAGGAEGSGICPDGTITGMEVDFRGIQQAQVVSATPDLGNLDEANDLLKDGNSRVKAGSRCANRGVSTNSPSRTAFVHNPFAALMDDDLAFEEDSNAIAGTQGFIDNQTSSCEQVSMADRINCNVQVENSGKHFSVVNAAFLPPEVHMEVEENVGRGTAGHSCMEAAGAGLARTDGDEPGRCTQGVRQNAATGTDCPGRKKPAGNSEGAGYNAWNRARLVAFDSVDVDEWSIDDTGPVILDCNAVNANRGRLEKALVGKLFGRKLPFSFLNSELQRRWAPFGQLKVITVSDDCFVCLFESHDAREAVLMGGPWIVGGQLIGLDRWSADFSPHSLDGLSTPVWIRFPSLPLLYWDRKNIGRIAARIGHPIGLDHQTDSWGRCSYARACVRLDLSKQLPKGVWVSGVKGEFFQKVEYEGISMLCFRCGRVGHKADKCMISPHGGGSKAEVGGQVGSPPQSPVEISTKRVGGGLTRDSALNKTQKADALEHNSPLHREKGSCPSTVQEGPMAIGAGQEKYGPWILVASRKNKPKNKPMPISASTHPKGEKQANIFGNWKSDNNLNSSGLELSMPDNEVTLDAAKGKGSHHPSTDSSPFHLPKVWPPGTIIFSAGERKKRRPRVSKAHFEKELKQLGPVEPLTRKRRFLTETTHGGDDSPRGA